MSTYAVESSVTRTDGMFLEDTSPLTSVNSTKAIIAGDVVRSYDDQIGDYNQEIVALNTRKQSFREKKLYVQGIKASEVRMDDNQTKGRIINSDQQAELKKIAFDAGVNTDELYAAIDSGFISEENLDTIMEGVDSQIKNLNSTSEIKMIYFQSVIDARKQAMMMLSNLMKSDSDTKAAIIQNMK